MSDRQSFHSFAEFYPYYLEEHSDPRCRALHYVGSSLVHAVLAWVLVSGTWFALLLLPVVGYGFAWAGHFFFEHNRPATFRHPVYSRYKRAGSDEMDESFFPVLWRGDGHRSAFLEPYLAAEAPWHAARVVAEPA